MKKSIAGILSAALLLASTLVWYSCTQDAEVTTGDIYGTVTDLQTSEPIGGVNVKLMPSGEATLTGSDGTYEFRDLKPDNYSLFLSKATYADLEDDYIITVEAGKKTKRDVQMHKKIASLRILDMQGEPLDTLDFGSEESVTAKTFNIFNDGTEKLDCSVSNECEWITSVSGLESSIQPGQTKTVTVKIDRVALTDGVNIAILGIVSGSGSNEVVVKATFLGAASISTAEASSVTASSATVGGTITDDGGRPVLVRGICYGTSQSPDINGDHTEDGSGTGSFSHNITNLSSSTTYYARAYATNRNGTYYASNIVSFTTNDGLPTVSTTDVTDITGFTAKSGGNVTSNGGFNVTARGVCWNTLGSPDLNDDHTTNGNGNGTFVSNLTNLDIGTTYFVRAYATNSHGTSYGEERSFSTPAGDVTIEFPMPTNITAQSATCTANVTDNGGLPIANRGFCWATTQYPTIDGQHVDLGMGAGNFSLTITSLQPATTYYVRAYVINAAGTTYSTQRSFTTTSGLPSLTTATVSNVTASTAQCGGTISDNGGFPVTARGICWNTMGNPDLNGDHTINGTGNGAFTANMTGLTPGVTYHVRAYATNSTGTSYGNEQTFTTTDGLPQVTTESVSNITATTAQCGGTIPSDGGFNITARGVCWNTMGNPDISGFHTTNGMGTGAFTANMNDLTPGTTYHVRAYATNSIGTVYGSDVTFTTSNGNIGISISNATNITAVSASCTGSITSDGGSTVTERGFCWSTSQYPVVTGSHIAVGSGTGSFTSSINNLTPSSTYYLRAYATNAAGTSYSSQISFSTPSGLPVVNFNTSTGVSDITATSAEAFASVYNDGGFPITAKGFCWSTAQNPTTANSHSNDGSGIGSFNGSLTGLSLNTTYYVRAYATNSIGTAYSAQATFTTSNGLPSVTTGNISNIMATSAVCSGNITSNGGFDVSERGFCWNRIGNPEINNQHIAIGSGNGAFTGNISNLTPNTTYYVRAYATNSNGTVYGSQVNFTTTSGLPTVTTTEITTSNVTTSSVVCGGNVTDIGSAPVTSRGICWNTTGSPTIADAHSSSGSGSGSYTYTIPNITPLSQTYYIRAYATNQYGTVYGETIIQSHLNPYHLPIVTVNGTSYMIYPQDLGQMYWSQANSMCDNLSDYGFNDWRMFTLTEAASLHTNTQAKTHFTSNTGYWTSNKYIATINQAGSANWYHGPFTTDDSGHIGNVRPIRVVVQ